MHSLKSSLMTVVCAVASIAAWPTGAAGQQEGVPPVPIEGEIVFPGVCGGDVALAFVGKSGLIGLADGRVIAISPGLDVTVTLVADPTKSVTLNSTGAFHQFVDEKGNAVTVVTGRNILFDPLAGFVLALGNFSFAFDAQGNLVQPLDGTGQLVDICELLH